MSQTFSNIYTFQNMVLPPPPPPPPLTQEASDQEFIKSIEPRIIVPRRRRIKMNCETINKIKFCLASLVNAIRDMKSQEKMLAGNNVISDDEWKSALESIRVNKFVVDTTIKRLTGNYIRINRKVMTRRASKRRRQKRCREEYNEHRKQLVREREERSRKIDENLQKIKEDLEKAKKEEAKREADIVLKDVLRKKHDAKKSIEKLDALFKLRLARQNTAKGKGQAVLDHETTTFANNLKNLKSLWMFKQASYELEEEELRKKLDEGKVVDNTNEIQLKTERNLVKWKKALFGWNNWPQVDFNGDVDKFIAVRSEWDRFINNGHKASPMPIGWAFPTA